MLILNRKPGERIVIGEDVVVTVLNVHGNRIQLGIEAPFDVMLRREEIPRRSPQRIDGALPPVDTESRFLPEFA